MICPYCKENAQWVSNEQIYGKRYGKSYMCYFCKPCDAYVGCHQNSKRTLGTMANAELRDWRKKAHSAIDPLWKSGGITRQEVYKKLSDFFGKETHVAESDVEKCKEI